MGLRPVPEWRDQVARRRAFEEEHPEARIWVTDVPGWTAGHMGSLPVGGELRQCGPYGELRDLMDVMEALAEQAGLLARAKEGQ